VQNPRVSICVANLNSRKFLAERFESIFQQSFQDWELIVYDSFSDDGAWEYIQGLAVSEPRMRISQGPREGVYAGWNACLRQAKREYIYIATSDDTMSPDCLEKLVAALDENPECDLAHCCATFIDENSQPLDWKWETWPSVAYFGDLIKTKHIRPPGHDSLLAFALGTPYYSITQLLIRRSLFEKTGLFQTRWGSFGDLEWQMRATLSTATIHIPEHLATWRKHPEQASQIDKLFAAQRNGWLVEMVDKTLEFSKRQKFQFHTTLSREIRFFYVYEQLYFILESEIGIVEKMNLIIKFIINEKRLFFICFRQFFKYKKPRIYNLQNQLKRCFFEMEIGPPYLIK
jgi:glycosyltransferase involved in cell wall biosynthesis